MKWKGKRVTKRPRIGGSPFPSFLLPPERKFPSTDSRNYPADCVTFSRRLTETGKPATEIACRSRAPRDSQLTCNKRKKREISIRGGK